MCNGPDNSGGTAAAGTGTITASVRSLVPNHPACTEALALARSSLPASLLYHSFRVYLYAQAFQHFFQDDGNPSPSPSPASQASTSSSAGPSAPSDPDRSDRPASPPPDFFAPSTPPHVLFVASLLHDIGTATVHDPVPERFEVVSADAAAAILRSHGTPEYLVKDAWLAMALHTSPGIAERLGGTVRALRLAVRADFGSYPAPAAELLPGGAETVNVIRWKLPRLEIEKDLGDAVVRQALGEPLKAPGGSWPGDLVRAKREDPGWEGVNRAF